MEHNIKIIEESINMNEECLIVLSLTKKYLLSG